jgi:hypothetical protein
MGLFIVMALTGMGQNVSAVKAEIEKIWLIPDAARARLEFVKVQAEIATMEMDSKMSTDDLSIINASAAVLDEWIKAMEKKNNSIGKLALWNWGGIGGGALLGVAGMYFLFAQVGSLSAQYMSAATTAEAISLRQQVQDARNLSLGLLGTGVIAVGLGFAIPFITEDQQKVFLAESQMQQARQKKSAGF